MFKDPRRLLQHALFWGLYWLVFTLNGGLYDLDFKKNALFMLLDLPFTMCSTYLLVYRILPLFFRKKWITFGLATLLTLALTMVAKRFFMQYVEYPWLYADSGYSFTFFNWYRLVGHLVQLLTATGIVAGLKYYRDWQRAKGRVEALSAEKRIAELSFLRAQMHPHFLFNTLNSLYYEVMRKSDGAGDLIIRLSDLLRFILYECKDDLIPLSRELELIENYIALQRCRFGDRLSVDIMVQGDKGQLIPPMICLGLIENAFKHGTTQKSGLIEISLRIEAKGDRLLLEVQNPYEATAEIEDLGATKGIGLENMTQQLRLLYADQFQLQLQAEGERFVSRLAIPLNAPMS